MNFENFDFQKITTEEKFSEKLNELIPKDNEKIYLLFDEIQVVEDWQRVVNGIRVSFDSDISYFFRYDFWSEFSCILFHWEK